MLSRAKLTGWRTSSFVGPSSSRFVFTAIPSTVDAVAAAFEAKRQTSRIGLASSSSLGHCGWPSGSVTDCRCLMGRSSR